MTSLAHTHTVNAGTTTLASSTWHYDAANNLTQMNSYADTAGTSKNPSDPATWASANYTYDNAGQLQTATYNTPPGGPAWVNAPANENYGYDANGNRDTNGNTVQSTGNNQIDTDAAGNTYTYDAEGNVVEKVAPDGTATDYTWDYRNRLIKVSYLDCSGGWTMREVDYVYDAFNRLIEETTMVYLACGNPTTQTVFIYDGTNVVLQFEGTGMGPMTFNVSNLSDRYLWGPAVDQILADEKLTALPPVEGQSEGFDLSTPGAVLWGLADNEGSIRDVVSGSGTNFGTVVDHRFYNSFGVMSETHPEVVFIFGYTGKYFDTATGLQNNLNRWYDPSTGRFLSQDPLGFAGGDPNLYRYVGNGPTTNTDPLGLCEDDGGSTSGEASISLCAAKTSKSTAKPRLWTDKNGKPLKDNKGHEVGNATVIAVTKQYIFLRTADGTIVRVTRKNVSKGDEQYVATVKLGYKVYFIQRRLEAAPGDKDKSQRGVINHRFIVFVDDDGHVVQVYSWMSGGKSDEGYWVEGNTHDWAAAQDDLTAHYGTLVGSGDGTYFRAFQTAFKILQTNLADGNSSHPNGLLFANCFFEVGKLVDLAGIVEVYGEEGATAWIKEERYYDLIIFGGAYGPRIRAIDWIFIDTWWYKIHMKDSKHGNGRTPKQQGR